jgi:hypothetical protein
MATFDPYIEAHPGELITAQAWNGVQVDVKEDIAAQIEAAKTDLRTNGVDIAKNADEFADKTPDEWKEELDERYAPKIHDHQAVTVWRRYIKRFTPDVNEALLEHDLGRYPIVDTYRLHPVATAGDTTFGRCKIMFFASHADADDLGLRVRVYRDRALRGIIFERLAAEIGLQYNDDSSIADVVDDFWTQFMLDPNDEIDHCQTPWIDSCCERNRTVGELKRSGDWDDLYIALNPRKCGLGAELTGTVGDNNVLQVDAPACRVEIAHVNYDTLHVAASRDNWPEDENGQAIPLDLMLLLRI